MTSLKERLPNITDRSLNYLVSSIRDYFQTFKFKENLLREYEKNNKTYICNFYGRAVSTLEIGTYALINRFIQSSAVDVALLGFSNIISTIKEMDLEAKIIPNLILHDGIFFDIHKDSEQIVPLLCKVGSKNIPGFENKTFYISSEKLT
jgi:DNA polymerase I-like protein with 3'-5' exonuclease and polymerase domains